jgi:hypothetical protein
MRVQIGFDKNVSGIVELAYDGLTYEGDVDALQKLIEPMRKVGMSDHALVKSLPNRLKGRTWAVDITERPFVVIAPPEEKFNPYHVPAGSPEGGQFDHSPGKPGSRQAGDVGAVQLAEGISITEYSEPRRLFIDEMNEHRLKGTMALGTIDTEHGKTYITMTAEAEAATDAEYRQNVMVSVKSAMAETKPEHIRKLNEIIVDSKHTESNAMFEVDPSTQRIRLNMDASFKGPRNTDKPRQDYVIKHELGHAAWESLTPAQRQNFAEMTGHYKPEVFNPPPGMRISLSTEIFQSDATVKGPTSYGTSNIFESWAESYTELDWNTGKRSASLGSLRNMPKVTPSRPDLIMSASEFDAILAEVSEW